MKKSKTKKLIRDMKELDNYEIISEALGRVNKELEYAYEYAEALSKELERMRINYKEENSSAQRQWTK
jgi:hypothetical protein